MQKQAKDLIKSFASSPLEIKIEFLSIDEKNFIIIKVEEFSLLPIVCIKSGEAKYKTLEDSGLYIRTSMGKPSSVKINKFVDMHNLLDRAITKRLAYLNKIGLSHEIVSNSYDYKKERGNF